MCSSALGGSHASAFPDCLDMTKAQLVAAPSGQPGADQFGDRIAIDDNILVGGGSGNHASSNKIYVFSKASAGWEPYGEIASPADVSDDDAKIGSGYLAVDGHSSTKRVIAGTRHAAKPCYIFKRAASGWELEATLNINEGTTKYSTTDYSTSTTTWRGDIETWKVAIDGNTAVCANPRIKAEKTGDETPKWQGRAWVFTYDGSNWKLQQVLEGEQSADVNEETYDFGYSVAMKAGIILVGGPSIQEAGEAYVWKKNGDTWASTKIVGPATDGGRFGHSVSIGSATAIAITNPALVAGNTRGKVYVYTSDGTSWTKKFEQQSPDVPAADYGVRVRMQSGSSGHHVVVSASGKAHGTKTLAGSVYWYHATGDTWSKKAELTSLAAPGANVAIEANLRFGGSIDLNSNALLVVGCSHKREQTGLGTVFAYPTSCPAPAPTPTTPAPAAPGASDAGLADSRKPSMYISAILLTIMAVLA